MSLVVVDNAQEQKNEHPTFAEDADFQNYLSNTLGMMIFEMPKDGNCFYSALALQFHKSKEQQNTVRTNVAFAFLSNRQDFANFLLENETVASKASRIRKNGEWAGELEIAVASTFYETNILIFQANGYTRRIPENLPFEKTVLLSYHNRSHYNLLMDTGSGNGINQSEKLQVEFVLKNESNEKEAPDFGSVAPEVNSSPENMEFDYDHDTDIIPPSENDYESTSSEREHLNDDMDSSQSQTTYNDNFEDELEMINLPGNAYLKNKVFGKGRHSVDIIILVPKCLSKNDLVDSLKHVNGRAPIFYTVGYANYILQNILDDKEVCDDFAIFLSKKSIPLSISKSSIRTWYAKLMIPHVILSIAKMKCMNNEMRFLFFNSNGSLVPNLILQFWNPTRRILTRDIDTLSTDSSLFCEKCSSNCHYRNIIAHLDLSTFFEVNGTPHCIMMIFRKLQPFENDGPSKTAFLNKLKNNCNAATLLTVEARKETIYKELDNLSEEKVTYSSYLLLIVDGPTMSESLSVENFLNDKQIYKSLYAGYTKNGDYRMEHIKSAQSPVGKLHTKTSRTFLLRSQKYDIYTKCRDDEATVIEILKLTIEKSRKDRKPHPFILLNTNSEASELLGLNNATKTYIRKFCDKGIPIFTAERTVSSNPTNKKFQGNCLIGHPLHVPIRSAQQEFCDVAHIYDSLKKSPINVSHC